MANWGGGGWGGRSDVPKASFKDTAPVIRRLFGLIKPYRRTLYVTTGMLFLTTPLSQIGPLFWRYVVDEVLLKEQFEKLIPVLVVMSLVQLLAVALDAIRGRLLDRSGASVVRDLRNRVYGKLQGQSLAYFHKNKTGDLQMRVMDDVNAIQEVAIRGFDGIVSATAQFLWVCGMLIYLQAKVGLLSLLPVFVVWAANRWFGRRMKGIYKEARDIQGDIGAKLSENLQGVTVIKGFAREGAETAKFEGLTRRHLEVNFKAISLRTMIFMPVINVVTFVSNLVMLGAGAYYIKLHQFTVGGLLAYRGYWWMFYSPIYTFSSMNDTYQRAGAAARRIFEVLDSPESVREITGAKTLGEVRGELEFRDVRFSYETSKEVLTGLSFKIRPGERIAFVGDSGAGKSTLLSLIPRFFDPTGGTVLLDGVPVGDLTLQSLRSNLALVQQETFLFDATILDNIRYGRPEASLEEVRDAARAANADSFIQELPKGYETLVGERGVRLSGGQKQRVSVARAFLSNPRILILDEPTSSVEPESERVILQALERLMQGRTTFVTSHRLSLIRNASRILVLEGGRVSAQGTHDELMVSSPLYARMVRLHLGEEG